MVLCRSLKRPMSSSTSLASGSRVWIENGGGVTKTGKVDASSGTTWSRKQPENMTDDCISKVFYETHNRSQVDELNIEEICRTGRTWGKAYPSLNTGYCRSPHPIPYWHFDSRKSVWSSHLFPYSHAPLVNRSVQNGHLVNFHLSLAHSVVAHDTRHNTRKARGVCLD